MSLGSVDGRGSLTSTRQHKNMRMTPVSLTSNWVVLLSDLATADNGGNGILNPAGISRPEINALSLGGLGTGLELCVEYVQADAWTEVTVQLFGFDSGAQLDKPAGTGLDLRFCRPQRLFDSGGTHDLVFSSSATDLQRTDADGVVLASTTIKLVDCCGAAYVLSAVKTAATGAGAAGLRLLAKILN